MAGSVDCQQQILTGVVAYVEVWSSNKTENYSRTFARQLIDLGAKISKSFNKEVTHVVFKDGHQRTWNKAKRTGVKLVSVLWVEKCREAAAHIDEDSFPAINGSEGLPRTIKKHKCMQPKDFIEKTPENDRRLQKRLDKMVKELDVQKAAAEPDVPVLLFDEGGLLMYSPKSKITDTCSAMEKRIQEMKEKRENLSPTASQMTETCTFTFGSTIGTHNSSFENTLNSEFVSGTLNSSYDDLWENSKYRKETDLNLKCVQKTDNDTSACTVTTKDGNLPVSSNGAVMSPQKLDKPSLKKQLNLQGIGIGEAVASGKRKVITIFKNRDTDQCELSSITIANEQNKVVCSGPQPDECVHTEKPTGITINDSNEFDSTSDVIADQPITYRNPSINLNSPVLLNGQGRKCKLQNNSRNDSLFSSLDGRTPMLISKRSDEDVSPVLATLNKSSQGFSGIEAELQDYEDYFSPINLKESKTKLSRFSLGERMNKSPSPPLLELGKKLSRSKRKKSPEATVKECSNNNKKPRSVQNTDTLVDSLKRTTKQNLHSKSELTSSNISDSQNNEVVGTSSFCLGSETDAQNKNSVVGGSGGSSSSIHVFCEAFKEQKFKYTEESKKEKYKKSSRTLVMTSMPSEKQNAVIQVVNKFGGFLFSDHVCETTTHVVAGSPRRTLNVMLGIARGCWIVSYDWVLWSLDHGHWIPEEPYELSSHFPAAPICRLQRHLSAEEFQHDLFSDQPAMYISLNSQPPCQSLTELVQLCRGKVCKTVRQAKIFIGDYTGKKHPEIKYLSEKWILDSITQHQICPLENYLLTT
ncbi:microcephalin [Microcaecilia unicolor]|uniref:Microcephalin n=1 Tax=Microcaecilia unicolor TaxID=1415580 RepID=A0A6P7XWG1_9AMPH|nr:microcephalin [Microcaecilia unicolor]